MSTLREILKDTTIMKALAGDCINCRELRAEVERLKKCHAHEVQNTINALNRAEKAEAEVERLEKELKRIRPFVQHLWDCVSNFPMTPPQGFNRNSCSCGLQAAQEKGE